MIRGVLNSIKNRILPRQKVEEEKYYEYCPRCYANITLQKGYRNDLPFWSCLGCGEMLINPTVESESDISWICDQCGSMLNIQQGFREDCGEWACTECGYVNKIDMSEVYTSEDEYQAVQRDPYKGLSDKDVLELLQYRDSGNIDDRPDIILVRHVETGQTCIKKLLTTYDRSVYEYLKECPIRQMPRIIALYEGDNRLIVIEEYIEGRTVGSLLDDGPIPEMEAARIARDVCIILKDLHGLDKPIIHRDIKPSNIIISPTGEIWLLDMNAAKWFDSDQTDDTRYMGTQNYAAPEQVGYGLSASSAKTDIYAVGMLLNVMITGHFPKEERAGGRIWDIIERCISLEADRRYTATELVEELDRLMENMGNSHASDSKSL